MRHQQVSSWVAVTLLALATFSVKAARADDSTCQADSDCGKGYSCQVSGGSVCGSAGCAPGETCDASPPCEPTVYKSCEPAPCATDSDCADGMVCHQSTAVCPGVICQGETCPPVTCEASPKQCTPKYLIPCAADADCGAGFTCNLTACSGGTTAVDAGAPDTPSNPGTAGSANLPPDTTSCVHSNVGSCQLTPVTCQKDGDCQAGWSCVDANAGYGCAEGSGPREQGVGGSANSADGGTPASGASAGTSSSGAGATTPSAGASGKGCPPPPAPKLLCTPHGYGYEGSVGFGSPTGGSSGGATSAGNTGSGASAPTTPERGATNDASGGPDTKTSTSCAVSVPGGARDSGFALLALGLFGFIRRRRATLRS